MFAPFLQSRAYWLVTLLAESNPSDAEIRAAFVLSANSRVDDEVLKTRAASLATFAPTAFYTCLAAYFSGDDRVTAAAPRFFSAS